MPVHPAMAAKFPLLERAEFECSAVPDDVPAVSTTDTKAGSVPVRIYGTGSTCLVWLHGGAFRMGDLDMPEADRVARELAHRAGIVVVSVGYRLAVGGVAYPAPLDDVVTALRWVRAELGVDRVCAGGASAGGNLAAGAALRLRDEDGWQPVALALAYPVLHPLLPPAPASLVAEMAEVPAILHFPPGEVRATTENYLGGPLSRADGYAMPGLAVLKDSARPWCSPPSTTTCASPGRCSPGSWPRPAWTSGTSWCRRCCTGS